MLKNNLSFHRCNLYELELTEVQAHNGVGLIDFKRILTGDNISGLCHFMDFTSMPPGTSIGNHTHSHDEEEYYLILDGIGVMIQNDMSFAVRSGDLIRNPPGGTHSLKNTGTSNLQLFVFELEVSN